MEPAAWFMLAWIVGGSFSGHAAAIALPFNTLEGCKKSAETLLRNRDYVWDAFCIPGDGQPKKQD